MGGQECSSSGIAFTKHEGEMIRIPVRTAGRVRDEQSRLRRGAEFREIVIGQITVFPHVQPFPGVGECGVSGLAANFKQLLLGSEQQIDGPILFHQAGDDVLEHVARLLEAQVRQAGWVARLGGDEFVVVMPACSVAHGLAVAEQLRAAVCAWEPVYGDRSFTLGVSVGLVPLTSELADVSAVLRAADMACYEAKRAGRNRVVLRSGVAAPAAPAASEKA